MAELLLSAECVAALIARLSRPYIHDVHVAVVGDVVRVELRGVTVPVLGRVNIVLLVQAALVDAATARVWIQVQRAAGLLTPAVRAFVRPLLGRLLKAAGLEQAIEVDSRHEMTVHLDRLTAAGQGLRELVEIRSLSAPVGAHAFGCVFQVRAAAQGVL